MSIWHSPKITIDNKSFFSKNSFNVGFRFLYDLFYLDGTSINFHAL